MDHLAAQPIKPPVPRVWRDRFERNGPSERQDVPSVLSSATTASGYRSARVLSLVLALEALRAAPDAFEPRP